VEESLRGLCAHPSKTREEPALSAVEGVGQPVYGYAEDRVPSAFEVAVFSSTLDLLYVRARRAVVVSHSFPDISVGVLIAVGAFMIQELVRYCVGGIMFRQRLRADVLMIVSNFSAWKPPNVIYDAGEVSMSLIWDYDYENLGDVYSNASHLTPQLFVRTIALYGACGRFDEMRRSYNQVAIEAVRADKKDHWIQVMKSHLVDIRNILDEIVTGGRSLLRDLNRVYVIEARASEMIETAE